MKKFIVLLLSLISAVAHGQPGVDWQRTLHGFDWRPFHLNDMVIDRDGSTFLIGNFFTKADLDPGPGVYNVVLGPNADYNIYVIKLDSNGLFQYAKMIEGPGDSRGHSIDISDNGDIYIGGQMDAVMDFDPGPDTFLVLPNAVPYSYLSGAVAKYDMNMNLIWAGGIEALTNGGYVPIEHVKSCPDGGVYITGNAIGDVDFDPDTSAYILYTDTIDYNTFLAKYDSLGKLLWAEIIGENSYGRPYGIDVDENSNVYITGSFKDTVDFDLDTGVLELISTPGRSNMYHASYSPKGKLRWVSSFEGNHYSLGKGVQYNEKGDVYFYGYFTDTVDFDPTLGTRFEYSPNKRSFYIIKYDTTGTLNWVKVFGNKSYGYCDALDMTLDDYSNIYISGTFGDTLDVDPGPDTFYLFQTDHQAELFFSKLDPNGNLIWAGNHTSTALNNSTSIKIFRNEILYVSGEFYDTIDVDMSIDTSYIFNNGGYWDGYILRYRDCINSWDTVQKGFCAGDTLHLRDTAVTIDGLYTDTIFPFGCKKIKTYDAKFNTASYSSSVLNTCTGDSVLIGSNYVKTNGLYLDTTTTYTSCVIDSVSISFHSLPDTNLYYNICLGDTLFLGGENRWQTGTYFDTLMGTYGCDSVVRQHLTVNSAQYTTDSISICAGDSIKIHGIWRQNGGIYSSQYSSQHGCDSTSHVGLFLSPTVMDSSKYLFCKGDSILFRGNYYKNEITITDSLINGVGCDSLFFSNLRYYPKDSSFIALSACDSAISPSGRYKWFSSGLFTDTLTNSNGCDSLLFINMTITQTPSITANLAQGVVCDSGSVTLGATSIVGVIHWYNSISGPLLDTGSFFNTPVIDSTRYFYCRAVDNGCSSQAISVVATVLNSSDTTYESAEACKLFVSIPWGIHTKRSDTIIKTYQNQSGCDSIAVYHITVHHPDTSLSFTGDTIICNADSATIEWYDCENDAIITGITGNYFRPTQNGSYAAIVAQNGCTDTTQCIQVTEIGIENNFGPNFSFQPNPTTREFTVNLGNQFEAIVLEISNASGQLISRETYSNVSTITTEIDGPDGMYFVKVSSGDGKEAVFKILKE